MVIIDAYLSCRLVNIRIWYSVVHCSANLQYRRSRITHEYIPESVLVNWGNAFQAADKKALISEEREGEWCYFCDVIHVTLCQGAVLCAKKNQKHIPRILTYILLLSAVTNSWREVYLPWTCKQQDTQKRRYAFMRPYSVTWQDSDMRSQLVSLERLGKSQEWRNEIDTGYCNAGSYFRRL